MKLIFTLSLLFYFATGFTQSNSLELWYQQPAAKWVEALPIGNGRIGAMIYGDPQQEHLQFNEETLWTGKPRAYAHPGAVQYLSQIRTLLTEGKQAEAETLAEAHFMGLKDNDAGYTKSRQAWVEKMRKDTSYLYEAGSKKNWKDITIPTPEGWETEGMEGLDGAVWFRTTFTLPADWPGKTLMLELGRIRDMDFTYINGKLVGTKDGAATNRHYIVDAKLLHPGANTLTVQVLNFYDKGGLIGAKSPVKAFILFPVGDNDSHSIPLDQHWQYAVQHEAPPPFPQYQASYQPFGDLYINFKNTTNVQDYRRALDISQALSTVSYNSNGVHYSREYLASAPQNTIAIHLAADKKGSIQFSARFTSPHPGYGLVKKDDHTISLAAQVKNGALKGVAFLHIVSTGGSINVSDSTLSIAGADEATLYLIAATNFKDYKDVSLNPELICRQRLKIISKLTYEQIKRAHIRDYTSEFSKLAIDLGSASHAKLPTDERIKQYNGNNDPSLISLYLQYGRYLLLSSSNKSSRLPANLQGIWNDRLTPSWGSKFTTNINLEMNYWPADLLNLSSTTIPFFNLVQQAALTGEATAKEHYGAHGWVLHHNTDIWAGTAPINASNHGIWVTGAAWLCHHLWDHYLFTQDTVFLKQTGYPIIRQAALFYLDFLYLDPKTGYYISSPSNSPEQGGLVAGPSMDHQIIRDLFKSCILASRLLRKDAGLAALLQEKYDRIAPNQIGSWGQLQEWMQDKDDSTNTHRHVSHLWAVYPGTEITSTTPGLLKAARRSLVARGDGGTGWSLAWKLNLWARMRDGDHAKKILDNLLAPALQATGEGGGVYPNLFDAHPPFQIDGNFGGAAGIAEMLLQSQDDTIEILPALPTTFSSGSVKGLCARGGFEASFQWKDGKLINLQITSKAGKVLSLRYGSKVIRMETTKGKVYSFNGSLAPSIPPEGGMVAKVILLTIRFYSIFLF